MKKYLLLCLALLSLAALWGCGSVSADYPAAIMVEGQLYLKPAQPSPGEVAPEAIIGTTTSYTDEMPDEEGETNFDRELGCPYARVKEGVAVLYSNEWYICTPME